MSVELSKILMDMAVSVPGLVVAVLLTLLYLRSQSERDAAFERMLEKRDKHGEELHNSGMAAIHDLRVAGDRNAKELGETLTKIRVRLEQQ